MISQKKTGAILGYVYTALQSVICIVYIPILLNTIGKSEYGIYQIVGSVIAYFAAMEAPLCASVLKFYVESKVKDDVRGMENVLATGRRIFYILSVVFVIISIPSAFVLQTSFSETFSSSQITETLWMFGIMIFNLIITMNSYVYLAAINGHERLVFVKLSSIVTLIVQPIIVVLILQQYKYALVIVAVQCVLNIVMALIRRCYAVKKLNCTIKFHGFDKAVFRGMMALTLATLGVALADQIFWKSDQIILGSMIGPDIVAEYSIGSQLNAIYISVACVLGSVILPTVTKLLVNGSSDDVSKYFARIGRYQSILVVLVLTGVVAFGQEFIVLLAGEGYQYSYIVALLLMIPYSIDLIQTCGSTILQVKNQYVYRTKMMIAISLVKIGLTIILVKIMGPIGAALSTTVVIILGNGLYLNYIYSKKIGIDLRMFITAISKIWVIGVFMLPISCGINMLELSNKYLQFGIHVTLFTLIYALLIYSYELDASEKRLFLNIMKS